MKLHAHIRTEFPFGLRNQSISLLVEKMSTIVLDFKGVFYLSILKMSINAQLVWWCPIKFA